MTTPIPSNTTTRPLAGSAVYYGGWISTTGNGAVQAVVNSDAIGTLIFQYATSASVDALIYEDSFPYAGLEASFFESTIKAQFLRCKYLNGTNNQTSFSLVPMFSREYSGGDVEVNVELDPATSGVSVYGVMPDASLEQLQLDADGNLKTSATLSVEGVLQTHDASAVELLEQIADGIVVSVGEVDISGVSVVDSKLSVYDASAVAQMTIETNRILYDTDIIANRLHDISGTVALAGVSLDAGRLPTYDGSSNELLSSVYDRLHDVSGVVAVEGAEYDAGRLKVVDASGLAKMDELNLSIQNIELELLNAVVSPAYGDFDTYASLVTQGAGTWSLPADGQEGWEYNRTALGGASLNIYSNTTLVPDAEEGPILLGNLATAWYVGNYPLAVDRNEDKLFYIAVYTQPTGVNDYQPWYHSSQVYVFDATQIVSKGGDCMFYIKTDLGSIHKDMPHFSYVLAQSNGECGADEVIQFIQLNVDSAVPVGDFRAIVKYGGYSSLTTGYNTNKENIYGSLKREKDARDNLASLVVADDKLAVYDASACSLLAEIADGITVQVGEVDISGVSVVDEKLSVYDASCASHLSVVEEILENGFVNVYDASCELLLTDIKTQTDKLNFNDQSLLTYVSNQITSLEVSNFPTKQSVFVENTADGADINVNVTNASLQVEGTFWQETQPVSFASGSEVALVAGSQVGISAGSSIDINNFPSKQSVFVENTAEGFDIDVNVTNSTLDIHAYGVHNENWVGLITDSNGHLIVHSELQDGQGTDLTSTSLSGGVQALDVAVKNDVSVSNTQETALVTKYLDASAVQIANNLPSVYGAIQIGSSVDTNGFLWVAGQMFFGSVINGGNVYLEYSTDGTNWGRRFDSAFISTGSNVSAVIIPSAPSPFRYARLYADSGLQSTNVSAWITMK